MRWERNGQALTPTMELTITNGSWRDSLEAQIYLHQGEQVLRLNVERGAMQINAIRLEAKQNPVSSAALCRQYQGGFGDVFDCFEGLKCRKINEDWEHNHEPAYWCVVHEL